MKQTGESRGLGHRERETIHGGTHPFSHTRCRCKSLMVPRAALVRGSAQRGGQRGRLARKSQEPHISKRAPQVTQPVCTLSPRVSGAPPSYLRPWVPPSSSRPFFSTLFPSSSFLITGSSSPAACRGGARNAALPANRHLSASHWPGPCML